MKRYGNIFDSIISIENLREAHRNASKGKKSYRQVRKINKKTDFYLYKIQNMLKNGTYRVSKYRLKIINDKGKQRELYKLPYYPDRIIQWAIMLQIENILVKTFCYHTCASIAGRGINRAVKLSKKYTAKSNDCRYCLKFDIKKFYPSIDQTILKNMLRKKFKDKRLLSLLDLIIDSFPRVDFAGYRFFGTFTLLRKRIALRYKRKARKLSKKPITAHSLSSFFSYFGFTIPANTKRFFKKNLQNLFARMKTFVFRQRMIKRGYVPNYEPLY